MRYKVTCFSRNMQTFIRKNDKMTKKREKHTKRPTPKSESQCLIARGSDNIFVIKPPAGQCQAFLAFSTIALNAAG